MNYLLQCSTAIGVVVLLPFLGVSSLNFGPLATAAFFLASLISAMDGRPAKPCLFGPFGRYSKRLRFRGPQQEAPSRRQCGSDERDNHEPIGHPGCAI
jgi:hypothetical protein